MRIGTSFQRARQARSRCAAATSWPVTGHKQRHHDSAMSSIAPIRRNVTLLTGDLGRIRPTVASNCWVAAIHS